MFFLKNFNCTSSTFLNEVIKDSFSDDYKLGIDKLKSAEKLSDIGSCVTDAEKVRKRKRHNATYLQVANDSSDDSDYSQTSNRQQTPFPPPPRSFHVSDNSTQTAEIPASQPMRQERNVSQPLTSRSSEKEHSKENIGNIRTVHEGDTSENGDRGELMSDFLTFSEKKRVEVIFFSKLLFCSSTNAYHIVFVLIYQFQC